MTDWLNVLRQAVDNHPRGAAGVGELIGYSRPAVSRALSGTYGDTTRLERAVMTRLPVVACPHLDKPIARTDCTGYATRSYASIAAADVPHWRACRRCPHKPEETR